MSEFYHPLLAEIQHLSTPAGRVTVAQRLTAARREWAYISPEVNYSAEFSKGCFSNP
jgi:hypothetical protein